MDPTTLSIVKTQAEMLEKRAKGFGADLVDDPYLFSDAVDGAEPGSPMASRSTSVGFGVESASNTWL
jgi:hypothetical protein